MSRKPVDTARYDADNLAWAKRILSNPRLHEHPYDGAVQVARMIVERLEQQKNLDRQMPDEGKEGCNDH